MFNFKFISMKVIKSNPDLMGQKSMQSSTSATITSTRRTINYDTRWMPERYVCACVSEK